MAKNLQTVLNSVVNELLQEDGTMSEIEKNHPDALRVMDQNSVGIYNILNKAKADGNFVDVWNNMKGRITPEEYNQLAGTGILGRDALRNFQSDQQLNAINAQNDVPFSDQAYSTWLDAKNRVNEFVNDHPYATAGIGTGLGAALAAGAGALYLRKKQREANRAAGR